MTDTDRKRIEHNGRMGGIAGAEWQALMAKVLQHRFFGKASMVATIEDGTIRTIHTINEQTHK